MGGQLSSNISQFFPPKPHFTEANVPDLKGKVYVVSGSSSGIGQEVARVLYSKNAKVYIAARSEDRAKVAMKHIKNSHPASAGSLTFLPLNLNDLSTIKASAERFLAAENKLHVLFNNAGVMSAEPITNRTPQGHEINMGVNCLATFLFTKLLTPTIVSTAKTEPSNSVRVVWVSSSGTELVGLKNTGVPLDNLDYHNDAPPMDRYGFSKTGNYLQGIEYAKRHHADGIISIPLNPGNLGTELAREQGFLLKFFAGMIVYPPIRGAYTELFAGFSPTITMEQSGKWVIPWGRIHTIRKDLIPAGKTKTEGGNGSAAAFWEWCEEQVKPHL